MENLKNLTQKQVEELLLNNLLEWSNSKKVTEEELLFDFWLKENEDGSFDLLHKRDDFSFEDVEF